MARTVENSRSAQSHALNHRSSRSHCLITLSLRQIDAKGGDPMDPMDPWAHRAGLLEAPGAWGTKGHPQQCEDPGGCGKRGVVNCQTAGTGWYSINSSMNSTTHLGWIKTKASCRIWGEHLAKPAIVGLGLRWLLEKKIDPVVQECDKKHVKQISQQQTDTISIFSWIVW